MGQVRALTLLLLWAVVGGGGSEVSDRCDCAVMTPSPGACSEDTKYQLITDLQDDVGNLTCLVQDVADKTPDAVDIQAVISDIHNLTAKLAVLEADRELLLTGYFNNIRNDILALAGLLAQLHQDSADAMLVQVYHQQLAGLATILQQLQGEQSNVAQLQLEQVTQDFQTCNKTLHAPEVTDTWQRYDFSYDDSCSTCHGDRYVKSTSYTYQGKPLVVGAVLCSSSRYKIFLSDSLAGTFSNIADDSGHGQDHCELVGAVDDATVSADPFFGSCYGQGFRRSHRGDSFTYGPIGAGHSAYFYGKWYECGVTIP
ncbi:FNDC1 [Branchiostoma lanceolatum]|uniref:FNDC1 protein n=1 Tax=Branchiostoma lanceolatum TaxID=7740 RepID=A0A8J9ZM51_BRALA|nr:FNDC1 [Branchiostoma lanceolatum]